MANLIYPACKRSMGNGVFNLSGDTIMCALLTSAHVPNASHAVLADVSGQEASGTGYTAGGQVLSAVSWTVSGTAAVLVAANPFWAASTVTARYAVIYAAKTVGGLVNPLICLLDFGQDKGVTGGTFTVTFDAAGVLALD